MNIYIIIESDSDGPRQLYAFTEFESMKQKLIDLCYIRFMPLVMAIHNPSNIRKIYQDTIDRSQALIETDFDTYENRWYFECYSIWRRELSDK